MRNGVQRWSERGFHLKWASNLQSGDERLKAEAPWDSLSQTVTFPANMSPEKDKPAAAEGTAVRVQEESDRRNESEWSKEEQLAARALCRAPQYGYLG